MPFYLLSLAICFDRLSLCRIKAMRYAAWSAATILFALLLLGNLPFFENWDPGASLRTEGYDYGYLGARMGHGVYSQGGLNNALALAEKVRDRQDRDDLIGYITDMCWYIPIADRPEANLVAGGGQIAIGDVATFKAFADGNVEKGYRPILYRGLGRGLSWSHGSQFEKIGELAGVLDNGSARWAWQGVGDIEASRHGATVDWVTGTLEHLPESARGPFCEGVGARWRLDAVDRGDDLVRRMETLPEEVRAHCLAGRDLGVIRQPFSLLEW
ncbi:MAG: hypothetical protein NTZ78_12535 [Candidatus Aureabacteria bacterium]|nr:hypothetical protein [Candidatus Auribacterota bacterium]